MSKYYLELEQKAQHDLNIDESIKQLICDQQNAGFGFREYQREGYMVKDFITQYKNDFLQRTPEEKRKELEIFLNRENGQQNNPVLEKKAISPGRLQLSACKILWRSFRQIGFRGTKSKGHPDAVNDGCFLCIQNTPDEQKGMRVAGPDDAMNHVVLMNPFPILADQVTIASLRHEPQELTAQHVEFILHLAERSKEFKYTFNGVGAGASIPSHFHFFGFTGPLPIEEAKTGVTVLETDKLLVRMIDGDWPVICFVAIGDKRRISHWLLGLTRQLEQQNISMNVIFTRDNNLKAKVYVIPRCAAKPRPETGFKNEFGVVEMSGMIVCESTEAFEAADGDRVVEAMRQVGYPDTGSGKKRLLYDVLGAHSLGLFLFDSAVVQKSVEQK